MQNNYSLALSFIVSYSLFSEIEGVADGVNIAENGGVEDRRYFKLPYCHCQRSSHCFRRVTLSLPTTISASGYSVRIILILRLNQLEIRCTDDMFTILVEAVEKSRRMTTPSATKEIAEIYRLLQGNPEVYRQLCFSSSIISTFISGFFIIMEC